jgi:hypothetical protein
MTRYTPKELRAMTLKSLDQVGRELGLDFTKNHNRAERAKRILAAYADSDVAGPDTVLPHTPAALGEARPEFERLIQSDAGTVDADTETPQRGGARPGAGRPAGMTDDLSRLSHLSPQPHPVVKSLLSGMFQSWSVAAKCPEIALTEAEAIELALPWSQTLEYIGVTDRIPPWLHLGVMTLWTSINVVKRKAAVAREAARKRTSEVNDVHTS